MSSADLADPELLDVAWDLGPLLDGDPGDPVAAVDAMLAEAQQRADRFAERYAGRVAELDGPGLAEAMQELADLQELVARAGSFSGLHFSTDTAAPARGALYQRVQEKATPIETKLLFFELEWAALDDERADELLGADEVGFVRHHLRTAGRPPPPPAPPPPPPPPRPREPGRRDPRAGGAPPPPPPRGPACSRSRSP